jgi:hypothetical protein
VRWLLVAFPSKAPRFHPVFFLPGFFFAGAVTKKKRFSGEVRIKNSPGSGSSEPGLPSITRMDIDCYSSLHPGMTPANDGSQLHLMQSVRHGCRLASK